MYMNSGYLKNSHLDFKDKSKPLVVGSCGTYRLYKHPRLPTYRPRGRLDFQIIYVSAGIVTMRKMIRQLPPGIWYCSGRSNFRSMNIMLPTRQKYTGFILREEM